MQTKKNMWMDLLHLCTKIEKHNTQASEIFLSSWNFWILHNTFFFSLDFFLPLFFSLFDFFASFFLRFSKAQQPNLKAITKMNLVQI